MELFLVISIAGGALCRIAPRLALAAIVALICLIQLGVLQPYPSPLS